jgi:hypothetical protein
MAYEPPRNQYNRRRLAEIDQYGGLASGCQSCRQGALDSYRRAGWIEPGSAGSDYQLTDLGREVLAG